MSDVLTVEPRGRSIEIQEGRIILDASNDTLMKGRLPGKDIYMERFLSAADSTKKVSAVFGKI